MCVCVRVYMYICVCVFVYVKILWYIHNFRIDLSGAFIVGSKKKNDLFFGHVTDPHFFSSKMVFLFLFFWGGGLIHMATKCIQLILIILCTTN